MTTDHQLPDITAIRQALDAKYGDLPTLQAPKAKTPIDHPDWTTKPDKPDEDIALIESLAEEIKWRIKYLHARVTHSTTSIYNQLRAEFNDKGLWTPLAEFRKEFSIMEKIGLNIREDW